MHGVAETRARADWPRLPSWATPLVIFALLFLAAAAVNLLFGLLLEFRAAPPQLEMDEQEYYGLATQILSGQFEITPRRTVGYPLVLAGIRLISGDFLFLQVVLSVLYSLSAPVLFLLIRRLTGSIGTAALCGLALAFWPPTIFFGTSLYSETLALPIFVLALFLLPAGSRVTGSATPPDLRSAALAGLVLAVATHVRPMYLIFMPFLLVTILWEERRLAVAAKRALAAVLGFALLILPWSIYMTTRFHHPIVVTSNGGETLAGGLNPVLLAMPAQLFVAPVRTSWVGPGKWLTIGETGYLTPAELRLPYDRQDALLRARTTAWVKAHPFSALYLEVRKLAYMWGIYPVMSNGAAQALFGNLPLLVLLAVAGVALVRSAEARTRYVRLWIVPLFVSAVAAISWGSWRFRQPGDACLLAFCVIAIVAAWHRRSADITLLRESVSADAR